MKNTQDVHLLQWGIKMCLNKNHIMGIFLGVEVKLHAFLILACMEVSGQLSPKEVTVFSAIFLGLYNIAVESSDRLGYYTVQWEI